jgi:hypothetical protein
VKAAMTTPANPTIVSAGPNHRYRWHDNWATIPATPNGRSNGRTHGVVFSHTREQVYVYHQASPAMLCFDLNGKPVNSWGLDFQGAHGLSIATEGDCEYLWLTDEFSARVCKTDLDGHIVRELPLPDHKAYARVGATYSPTWAAQDPTGDLVWVGDGYGENLVHCFDRNDQLVYSLDGNEGAGNFKQPHGLACIPDSNGNPRLLITDRQNKRIVSYRPDGTFITATPDGLLHSPCSFGANNDSIIIPELYTGIKLFNLDLELQAEIGQNPAISIPPAWWPPLAPAHWPNLAGDSPDLQPGLFNSPHHACLLPNGNIITVEWIRGGRITLLERV